MRAARRRSIAGAVIAAAALVGGQLALAPTASATVSCPTLDLTTHIPTPGPYPTVNWSGCDLSGATLTAASLWLADLSGANLTDAHLAGAFLGQADLAGADLGGADLAGAGLIQADLTGADLTDARVSRARVSGAKLADATVTGVRSGGLTGAPDSLPASTSLVNGYLLAPEVDLTGAILSGWNLGGADLTDATLTRADLRGAGLAGVELTGTAVGKLRGCGVTGTPASLPDDWFITAGCLMGPGANLTGADLTSADLRGRDLTGARLAATRLGGAQVSTAVLDGVTSGAVIGSPASLPSGWRVKYGYLMGPGADLTDAYLAWRTLDDVNLTDARLVRANLRGASLKGTQLEGATMAGVRSGLVRGTPASLPTGWVVKYRYLMGPGANLNGINLYKRSIAGLNLTGAKLGASVLTGATVTGAHLSGASTRGLISGRLVGTPASLPSRSAIKGGFLVGPGTVISGVNLTGANLTGLSLAKATVTGTKLASATLTGVASGGIAGIPASLPSGWHLRAGYLVGPGADLRNAMLFGVRLVNQNLTNADLSGANLSHADLTGAILTGVTADGTKWTGTICPDGATAVRHEGGTCLGALIP